MRILFCLIFIAIFSAFGNYLLPDSSDEDILLSKLKSDLIKAKFQNIVIFADNNSLIIAYENKVYVDEIRAIKKIIKICEPMIDEDTKLILIPQNRGIFLAIVSIQGKADLSEYNLQNLDVVIGISQITENISKSNKINPYPINLSFLACPRIGAQLGNYDDPIKLLIYFAPKMQLDLSKGISFLAQVIIPIQNETSQYIRNFDLSILALNETFRIKNAFISATLGRFTGNRYGFDLAFRQYFGDGKLYFETDIGYTGNELKKNPYSLMALLTTEYLIYRYDLSLSASYGKYLYGDVGLRVDMFRYFNRLGVGIFFSKTKKDSNLGISLCVPSFLSKNWLNGIVNIGVTDHFFWEYRYKGFTNSAMRYNTGYSIDDTMKFVTISHIRNQIKHNENLYQ